MNPANEPGGEHEHEPALKRIEAVIERDVAEARALEPLVESAESVQQQVRSRLRHWLPLLGLVALGAVVVGSGLYQQLNLDTLAREHQTLAAWAERHPVLACGALVLSVATIISTGLPGSIVIIVAGGVILGTLKGALLAATGDTTGALILYFAARRLFMARSSQPPALVKRIRSGFEQNPASFAFFIRLVPIFPFGATSVALAWLGCRLRLFVTSSWLGVLPSSFIYASIGAGLGGALEAHQTISLNILAEPRFLLPLAGLGALALLPALFGLRRKPGSGTPPRQ